MMKGSMNALKEEIKGKFKGEFIVDLHYLRSDRSSCQSKSGREQ